MDTNINITHIHITKRPMGDPGAAVGSMTGKGVGGNERGGIL
jgi:hypothetical protein